MNSIEQTIYNNGVNIKTEHYFSGDGYDEVKDEYIQYDDIVYIFTFYEGELTNCRKA